MIAKNPDIIGLTESWANEKIMDSELALDGYDLFRRDRPNGMAGGGVLLYVKSILGAVEFKTSTQFHEQVWCRLCSGQKNELIIGVCYRTPNENIFGSRSHSLIRDLIHEISDKQ